MRNSGLAEYWSLLRTWALVGLVVLAVAVPPVIVVLHHATMGAAWIRWMPWNTWPALLAHAAWRTALAHGVALVLAGILLIPAWLQWNNPSTRTPAHQAHGIYGSATWRTEQDLDRTYVQWPERPRAGRRRMRTAAKRGEPKTPAAGVVIGTLTPPSTTAKAPGLPAFTPWVLHRDESTMIFGPTRAGKTRRLLLPTVAILARARESMVINDPKPELHDKVAGWLHAQGYVIARADLAHPEQGYVWEPKDDRPQAPFRWNPLTLAQTAWQEGRTSEATQWVEDVVQSIMSTQGSGAKQQDPFWDSVARSALSGTILALLEDAPPEKAHLSTVQALIARPAEAYDAWLKAKDPDQIARQMGQTYLETQEQTRVNGKTYTLSQLQNVLSAPIQWFMGASTFPLLRIAEGEPIALFLTTPDQRKSVDPIAVLFFNQLIQALSSAASQSPAKRLPRRVNFVLDEFGQLPPVPQFDRTVSVGLSRGLRMIVAVQNLSQLKQYPDHERETILGNCTTWICLRADNTETAQQLSQRVGQYDHAYTTQQHSSSGSSAAMQTSWGQQTVARPLLTTDELMRIPDDQAVVLQAGRQAAWVYLPDLAAWNLDTLWNAYPPPTMHFPMTRPAIWVPASAPTAAEATSVTAISLDAASSETPDAMDMPAPPSVPALSDEAEQTDPTNPEAWEIFEDLPF